MEHAGYVLLGLVAGVYGTMIGVGGGFLAVPALLLIFHLDVKSAVAASLFMVCCNALSGSISYGLQGRVDYKSGLRFAPAIIAGSALGVVCVQYIPFKLFAAVFGVLMVALSFLLVRSGDGVDPHSRRRRRDGRTLERVIVDARGKEFRYRVNLKLGIGISAAAGFVSSLLGIGGGVIHVPAMILWMGFPHHVAVATSQFVIAISAVAGWVTSAAKGVMPWETALLLAAGAVVGAQAGARIAHAVTGRWLARLLSLALVLVGARMLLMSLLGW